MRLLMILFKLKIIFSEFSLIINQCFTSAATDIINTVEKICIRFSTSHKIKPQSQPTTSSPLLEWADNDDGNEAINADRCCQMTNSWACSFIGHLPTSKKREDSSAWRCSATLLKESRKKFTYRENNIILNRLSSGYYVRLIVCDAFTA